jgi:acetolactate synthase I/III small subunit
LTALKILSVLVENKPGMLFRVAHMIRLMRLNIEGLTCGVANGGDKSRLTMTVNGDDATLDFVARQLSKVIDVFEAKTYTRDQVVARELAIVKLNLPKNKISKARLKGSRTLESTKRFTTLEIVGTPLEVDSFLDRFDESQVLDMSRTGTTAIPRER